MNVLDGESGKEGKIHPMVHGRAGVPLYGRVGANSASDTAVHSGAFGSLPKEDGVQRVNLDARYRHLIDESRMSL